MVQIKTISTPTGPAGGIRMHLKAHLMLSNIMSNYVEQQLF